MSLADKLRKDARKHKEEGGLLAYTQQELTLMIEEAERVCTLAAQCGKLFTHYTPMVRSGQKPLSPDERFVAVMHMNGVMAKKSGACSYDLIWGEEEQRRAVEDERRSMRLERGRSHPEWD